MHKRLTIKYLRIMTKTDEAIRIAIRDRENFSNKNTRIEYDHSQLISMIYVHGRPMARVNYSKNTITVYNNCKYNEYKLYIKRLNSLGLYGWDIDPYDNYLVHNGILFFATEQPFNADNL